MGDYTDVCNAPDVQTINGVEYTFARLTVDDMAVATAHVRKTRIACLTESLDGVVLDQETRALAYVKLASEMIYTSTLVDDAEGRIMLIWLSLKNGGETHNLPTLRKEFPALPFAEMLDLMLWITGEKPRTVAPDPTLADTATDNLSPKPSEPNTPATPSTTQ